MSLCTAVETELSGRFSDIKLKVRKPMAAALLHSWAPFLNIVLAIKHVSL